MVDALQSLLQRRQFVRERELLEQLPFSRSTLLRKVEVGEFPASRYLNPGAKRLKVWLAADIAAWAAEWDRSNGI